MNELRAQVIAATLSKAAGTKRSTGESYLLPSSSQSCKRNRIHALHPENGTLCTHGANTSSTRRSCGTLGSTTPSWLRNPGREDHSPLRVFSAVKAAAVSCIAVSHAPFFNCTEPGATRLQELSFPQLISSEPRCLCPAFPSSAQIGFSSSDMAETTTRWSNGTRGWAHDLSLKAWASFDRKVGELEAKVRRRDIEIATTTANAVTMKTVQLPKTRCMTSFLCPKG
jgi:hypothetical protein